MSDLDWREIADSMLTKSLLEAKEYGKLLDNLRSSQSKDAARIILVTLMDLPNPSFNTFCGILRDTGLDSAKAVLRLVEPVKELGNGKQTARDVSPSMMQLSAEQQQQQEENEKQKLQPFIIQSKDTASVIDFSLPPAPFNVAQRNGYYSSYIHSGHYTTSILLIGKPKHVQEEVDRKQCKDQSAAANLLQNPHSPEMRRRPRSRSSSLPCTVLKHHVYLEQCFRTVINRTVIKRGAVALFIHT